MTLRRIALAGAVVVVGAIIWLVGLIAMSQYTEDICFDDLDARPSYGSYRQSARLWPPSIRCALAGSGVEPLIVEHRLEAVAGAAWLVGAPILVAGGALVTLRRRRIAAG
jgi:hypothetical protein